MSTFDKNVTLCVVRSISNFFLCCGSYHVGNFFLCLAWGFYPTLFRSRFSCFLLYFPIPSSSSCFLRISSSAMPAASSSSFSVDVVVFDVPVTLWVWQQGVYNLTHQREVSSSSRVSCNWSLLGINMVNITQIKIYLF